MRPSVRVKLTALYGGLFLLAGIALVVVNYLLVSGSLPAPGRFAAAAVARQGVVTQQNVPFWRPAGPPGNPAQTMQLVSTSLDDYRESTLSTLLMQSAIALVIAAALAVLLGWVAAGRTLRPLHAITSTARKLEAENMHRRIKLDGPDDELKELADTFDGMLDRLAESFDSQKRFVANASHELRTPLAVQRTLIEVAMADPDVRPEVRKLGEQLLHTNERSERMIEGLLVLARSDRGLTSRVPVRLDEVVASVLRASADLAAEHEITFETELQPRTVAGDPVLLERLVTNLVQNAIHYNEPGGRVYVRVGPNPALVVRNTGPRVRSDAVPALFEPFRRLERDRTSNGAKGAGLGLSIVRSVAQAHDGAVYAQPGESGGLVIGVWLPVTQ
ncbi:sensor histidine kinase [Amycolatopsis anabasis]|uniref:sensor histidine kinase n=1 Tax=Amycolatopsis anabasis TaxID=1840409 RepID=UPI00131CE775